MSDTTNQQINDVVAMLDGFMARGGGHMNVEFDDPSSTVKEVEELGCIDCAKAPHGGAAPKLFHRNFTCKKARKY